MKFELAMEKEFDHSADKFLKELTHALERMQTIQKKDMWNVSRTFDDSFIR